METKPRILVLYFSQTGQLRQILDRIVSNISTQAELVFAAIQPVKEFPFPWSPGAFFDAMPETVLQEPIALKPLPAAVLEGDYDLVLFGYQPWFLHPSQPATAFLKSNDATILSGKNVVTVIGCRNMWLNAQELVKENLLRLGAKLRGNIVLNDTNPNLVSVRSIDRWMFKGQKEKSAFLPAAGVQDADVVAAARFGPAILKAALEAAAQRQPGNNLTSAPAENHLHEALRAMGAVPLKAGLVLLEKRGVKNFRHWAKYIREMGGPGDPKRKGRVDQFRRLLVIAINILSPLAALSAVIQQQLKKKELAKEVAYFRSVDFKPGKI